MKRQRLGQHYLVDPDAVRRIVAAAQIGRGETVLEIGTGRGALTRELLPVCERLVAYELDPANFEATLGAVGARNLELHLADAFRERPAFDVLVATLPYSRSADFVEWLSQVEYDRAVVVLQEDFVQKIISPPGSRGYRAISAIAQISSAVRLGDRIGREAFSPQPRVDSRVALFVPRTRLRRPQITLVKRLFALRRRKLSSALIHAGIGANAALPNLSKRVFHLSPAEVYQLVSGAPPAA
ncbi:MAG TPA: rRNA adenine N-6-methyltransferase family protein [Nitrososphaerales archaeon]|nr:rRNA adenine N-6-methyltransferase family protein [Nitrososphaerales archaeon]